MELKYNLLLSVQREQHRFNRTFMELKFETINGTGLMFLCFNRTFMELKLQINEIVSLVSR